MITPAINPSPGCWARQLLRHTYLPTVYITYWHVKPANGTSARTKYQGQWGLLDHLIVSGNLLNTSTHFYTSEDKADVFRAPFLLIDDENKGGKQPFRTYYGMEVYRRI